MDLLERINRTGTTVLMATTTTTSSTPCGGAWWSCPWAGSCATKRVASTEWIVKCVSASCSTRSSPGFAATSP